MYPSTSNSSMWPLLAQKCLYLSGRQEVVYLLQPKQTWMCWNVSNERQKWIIKTKIKQNRIQNKTKWTARREKKRNNVKTLACNLSTAPENQAISNLISRTRDEAGKGRYFSAWAIFQFSCACAITQKNVLWFVLGVIVHYPKEYFGQLHYTHNGFI